MSYCRWSSDNWRSDVYVYEAVDGTWTTHVAGRKRIGHIPEHPSWTDPIDDEWQRQAKAHHDAVGASEIVPIGLPYDGKTFKDGSPAECWATLVMLRTAGYHVPQYALDELYEEASEAQGCYPQKGWTMNWQPIETAPKDGRAIRVKLSNGREIIAEFWHGPEGEADGNWAWQATQAFIDGDTDTLAAAEWVGWQPLPAPPASERDMGAGR